MDAGNIGYGAGGGIISALFTYLGFKQRLDRTDSDIADLKKTVVYKDTCDVCHQASLQRHDAIDRKLDIIISRLPRGKA